MNCEQISGSAESESGLVDYPVNRVNSPNGQKPSKPDCRAAEISTGKTLSLSLNEASCITQDVEMLSPQSPTCKISTCKESMEGTGALVTPCSTCLTPGENTSDKPDTPDTRAKEQVGERCDAAAVESSAHKTDCIASSVLNPVTYQQENSWTKLPKRYFYHVPYQNKVLLILKYFKRYAVVYALCSVFKCFTQPSCDRLCEYYSVSVLGMNELL